MLKSILFIFVLMFLLNPLRVYAQQDYNQAYEQSKEEFVAVKESVDSLKGKVDKTKEAISLVEKHLRAQIMEMNRNKQPIPESMAKTVSNLKNARMTLARSQNVLNLFSEYSDKAINVSDIYDDINILRKKMDEDRRTMGDLSANLRLLGSAMSKSGEYIPILGEAIEAYGNIATGMIDKLGEVSIIIDQNRNQDHIGTGTHDTNEKSRLLRAMLADHPELANTYYHSSPGYLYRPLHSNGSGLIWDEDSRTFYVIPENVPAEKIFRMALLTGKRVEPHELKILTQNWNSISAPRLQVATGLHNILNRVATGPFVDAFSKVNRTSNDMLAGILVHKDIFEAYYTYSPQLRQHIDKFIKDLYSELVTQGATGEADIIYRFVNDNKLDIVLEQSPPPVKNTFIKPVSPVEPIISHPVKQNNSNTESTTVDYRLKYPHCFEFGNYNVSPEEMKMMSGACIQNEQSKETQQNYNNTQQKARPLSFRYYKK